MGLSKEQRIAILLVIDGAFFLLELSVGYAVHSLALVADAFHMLNDVLSLCVGLWAVRVANTGSSEKYTYGWQRAETLGALVNGVFLVALCLSIFLEAIQRFVEPQVVSNPKLVLIVGCLGLASNILGLFLFHDHGHSHGPVEGGHSHDTVKNAEEGHSHSHVDGPADGHDERTPLMGGRNGKSNGFPDAGAISPSTHQHKRKSTSGSHSIPAAHHKRTASAFGSADDIPVHPASMRQGLLRAANYEEPITDDEAEQVHSDPTHKHDHDLAHQIGGNKKTASRPSKQSHASHNHAQPKQKSSGGGGHGHSHDDLNMRGVFLHVLGDALGNVGVIITALIIWLTSWSFRYYFDPAVSLVITVIILCSAIPLCKAASRILLQATPESISIEEIRQDIETLEGVESAHHLHVWQLSDTKLVASLHVRVICEIQEAGSEAYMRLAREIQQCLHGYGIHSSTIQPEFIPDGADGHVQPGSSSVSSVAHSPKTGNNGKAPSLTSIKNQTCMLDCDLDCGSQGQCCPTTVPDARSQDNDAKAAGPGHAHGHGHGHAH